MDSKYELIIYWSEDDASFVAEVPGLHGGWPEVRGGNRQHTRDHR